MDVRLVGHQLGQRPAQPDRLGRQLVAARVALVEDQVDDGQHRGEPFRQQMVGRDAERDAGRLDLPLGADQPLGHRRLGDEERAGDLAGGQAAQRPQRQRHLRLDGERRVAAGEDQLQPLVGEGGLGHRALGRRLPLQQRGLPRQRLVAAQPVDRAVAAGRDQPRAGIRRDALARPPLGGHRERLLGGLLGEVEVAEEADQRRQNTSPLVAEDLLERCYHSTTGRTSIAPPSRAAGIRAASSMAASRSSASKIR